MSTELQEAIAQIAKYDWWMEYVQGVGFRVRLFATDDSSGRALADVTDHVSLPAAIKNAALLASKGGAR